MLYGRDEGSSVAACPFCLFWVPRGFLARYIGYHINDVTIVVTGLGAAEHLQQQKGVWAVSQTPSAPQSSNPVAVTMTQMWVDLLGSGVNQNNIDGKLNA